MLATDYTNNIHNTTCCTYCIVQGCLGFVMITLSKEFPPQSTDMSVISGGERSRMNITRAERKGPLSSSQSLRINLTQLLMPST
jgi:hypothetical protein